MLSQMNPLTPSVMTSGTARAAAIPGFDLAGKTGTTSDYKDAWFVGYTGGFVTAVWVGKDDNKPMKGVSGGQSPAAIWRAFMTAALPRLKVGTIPAGPNPPANMGDPIGDLLDGMGEWFQGSGADELPPVDGPPPNDPGRMQPIPNPEPEPEPEDEEEFAPERPLPPPPEQRRKKEEPLFF